MPAALSRTHMPVLNEPSLNTGSTWASKVLPSRRTANVMGWPWLWPIKLAKAALLGISWPLAAKR